MSFRSTEANVQLSHQLGSTCRTLEPIAQKDAHECTPAMGTEVYDELATTAGHVPKIGGNHCLPPSRRSMNRLILGG